MGNSAWPSSVITSAPDHRWGWGTPPPSLSLGWSSVASVPMLDSHLIEKEQGKGFVHSSHFLEKNDDDERPIGGASLSPLVRPTGPLVPPPHPHGTAAPPPRVTPCHHRHLTVPRGCPLRLLDRRGVALLVWPKRPSGPFTHQRSCHPRQVVGDGKASTGRPQVSPTRWAGASVQGSHITTFP